ncbi:MAG: aminopeptidase [Gammaproteobacteria bacterium]|nr:aminopeptidase [Gammaproteobacteria bacterium]MBU2677299.1 aminopeptidase [Gammaproteobacteria bacterium]NNC57860.1 aminopeptidase [Woeseiaceae bacterium]NNL51030.1 aminopeptidase [Woeseiaceae bacterium]
MRGRDSIRRCATLLPLLLFCACGSGCYYMQAAAGQWQVMRKSEPIDEVLNEAGTTDELAKQLRVVQAARRFSIEELGLPDNKSYRNYADIERDYVVWNVFAAPEFSLEPKRWCFPVAGCVSYRGYFSREAAVRKSEQLARRGYDVSVGGASAYSTLGKLNDPVLSSMLSWDDTQLVGVLFHELAHQVLYVKGDSAFNESFATAVEEFGLERWLAADGRSSDMDAYRQRRQLRRRLMLLVAGARSDLRQTYAAEMADDEKRRLKSARLDRLSGDAGAMLAEAGRNPSGWLAGELNNAKLVSMTLYEGHLPSFRALLVQCEQDIRCFYAKALELSRLDKAERDRSLAALAQR